MLSFFLISVPILFVVGSLLHFLYKWTKKNKIVGVFVPVNESIFEHSKLLLIPLTIFYFASYIFLKGSVDVNNYFFAMLVSIVFSIIVMISFYYTYKEIIGSSYLWIDIFDLLLSLFMGQVLANHIYVYSEAISLCVSLFIIVVIFMAYIYLTFKPFKTPFFMDEKSKTYGINENTKS